MSVQYARLITQYCDTSIDVNLYEPENLLKQKSLDWPKTSERISTRQTISLDWTLSGFSETSPLNSVHSNQRAAACAL